MTITVTSGFATEALAWNRTRTISLGITPISAVVLCDLRRSLAVMSDRS